MITTTTTFNAILIHVHEYWNPFILNLAELDWSKNGILTAAAKCKYASGMFVNLGERTGDKKRALEANIKKKTTMRKVCHYLIKVSIQMVIEAQPETGFVSTILLSWWRKKARTIF